ncbi:DUF397 domain-containing protein [Streptomyces nigra]|uniref:DUF397 domain-containing protein n=1 Tax=Streptomyces nigra TaxID=1827580 RepID=UPI00368CE81E
MKRIETSIPDASALSGWRRSSYSGESGGNCLEVTDTPHPMTPVRDSKLPTGPALLFSAPAWTAFVGAVYRGRM